MIKTCRIITIDIDFINDGNNQILKDKFGKYFINYNFSSNDLIELQYIPQQILVLSDDKIKYGDWFFSEEHKNIFECIHPDQYFENEFKIIASYSKIGWILPTIKIDFIKKWIKEPKELIAIEYWDNGDGLMINNKNEIIATLLKEYVKFTTLTKEEVENDRCTAVDYLIKPNKLQEAANEYAKGAWSAEPDRKNIESLELISSNDFIAGAIWQKENIKELCEKAYYKGRDDEYEEIETSRKIWPNVSFSKWFNKFKNM